MCLVLIDKEKRNLLKEELISLFKKTNNSTITAYKILKKIKYDGTYFTPYQHYPIELNTHYYNEGKIKFTFYKGLNRLEVHQGLHAYTSFEKAKNHCINGGIIVKCIIPKGSEYFINKTKHEICSDNLIITDQIVYSNSII